MKSEIADEDTNPMDALLNQIADECGISIVRWEGETLTDFADRLIEDLTQQIIDRHDFIDEIRELDLEQDVGGSC